MDLVSQFSLQDIVCVLPALIVFVTSLVPLFIKVFRGNREMDPSLSLAYSLGGLTAALFSTLILFSRESFVDYAFFRALVFDGMSVFSTVMVLLLTSVALILSKDHFATRGAQFSEYIFLLLNASIGMMILSWSNDLIVTFIGIEMMSLSLYLIVAMSNEETLSKEASFKYFVLGSLASAIFLYGVAFIFGISGTTYIDGILEVAPAAISSNYMFLLGIVLAVLGFCFKVSIAPFHAWTPDVYEGAPTPVTAFMATGVKLVTFVAFLRLMIGDYLTSDITGRFVDVLQWLAVLTMLVGNIGAIMQNGVKRMLAYSSVAHSGYILMGLIAGAVGGQSWLGATGVTYYIFAYSIMTIGAFGVLALLERHEADLFSMDDLKGLATRSPLLAACFSLFLLSLAGIPPTVGFFGKFFVFSAAIKQGLFWMAVWGAINSVISVYYYLRPIVMMYMYEVDEKAEAPNMLQPSGALAISLMAFLVLATGIATEPVYNFVLTAVNSLF